jgi:hypothetical protein
VSYIDRSAIKKRRFGEKRGAKVLKAKVTGENIRIRLKPKQKL